MLLWSGLGQLLALGAGQGMAMNVKKGSKDHRRPLSPRVRALVITTRVLISSIAHRCSLTTKRAAPTQWDLNGALRDTDGRVQRMSDGSSREGAYVSSRKNHAFSLRLRSCNGAAMDHTRSLEVSHGMDHTNHTSSTHIRTYQAHEAKRASDKKALHIVQLYLDCTMHSA